MDSLETRRLIIRPFTLDDLADVHRMLDVDLEWAGPGVTLAQRREKLQLEIALAHWPLGKVRRVVALKERGNEASVNVMSRVVMRAGFSPDPQAVYPGGVGIIENGPAWQGL